MTGGTANLCRSPRHKSPTLDFGFGSRAADLAGLALLFAVGLLAGFNRRLNLFFLPRSDVGDGFGALRDTLAGRAVGARPALAGRAVGALHTLAGVVIKL